MSDLPVPHSRRRVVLVYALERWETLLLVLLSAAGIAGTIVFLGGNLAAIGLWLAFGLGGTGAMVVVSFRDAESIEEACIGQIDLRELRDRRLRDKVSRAQAYRRAISRAVREVRSVELRASLEMITRELGDPISLVFALARRLETHQADSLVQQDLRRLREQARVGRISPAERDQLATLEKLERLMYDTAAAIDSALAQMGNSYSAVQLARSTGEVKGGATTRVLDDLRSQSASLRDINTSLDEVYAERFRGVLK